MNTSNKFLCYLSSSFFKIFNLTTGKKGNMDSLTYSFQPSALSIPSIYNNTQHPVTADPASCYDAVGAPNEGRV